MTARLESRLKTMRASRPVQAPAGVPKFAIATLAAAALATAACGQSGTSRAPVLSGVPLTGGTRVVAHVRRCDRGANPYCSVQLVVVGGHFRSSSELLAGEHSHLAQLGWTSGIGDTGLEMSADSPGHKLRLTYAMASNDLQGLDLGWIQRSPKITRALSNEMFDRAPTLSLMLETGSS
jgi:hypothetical protein